MTSKSSNLWRRAGAGFIILLLVLAGTATWLFLHPTGPGALTLERVQFAALPGWRASNSEVALAALRRSCGSLLRLSPDRVLGGSGYAGTPRDWRAVCTSASQPRAARAARSWFENTFVPFAVSAGPDRNALFTGYYEPEIRASRTRRGTNINPIYGAPGDLATADLGQFRRELAGIRITGHMMGTRFVPFPPRAKIDADGLSGAPVLLYSNDPVAVFFLHIQGSGRARLDDGSMLRLAYAGQNGRPYTPIGRTLIARGDIDRGHMSMQAIRAWLATHPASARSLMESDQSYVFFRELPIGDPQLGSPGTEGVALTPEASVAVDPAFHALGVPMYVVAQAPAADTRGQPFQFAHLCIAQDTGGAIKGAVRADIFWGFGNSAEDIAGRMKSTGSLYVLLPKALAARVGARFVGR